MKYVKDGVLFMIILAGVHFLVGLIMVVKMISMDPATKQIIFYLGINKSYSP